MTQQTGDRYLFSGFTQTLEFILEGERRTKHR